MNDAIKSAIESPAKASAAALAAISISYIVLKVFSNKHDAHTQPYPPGPRRDPLIGAMRSFPKDHLSERFKEWAKTYGDVVYAPVPGMEMVILNSYEVAQDLLAKRPNSTAARYGGYMVLDLMGWWWDIAFLPPTEHHFNQRKMVRRGIGPQRVASHDSMLESAVYNLALELEGLQGGLNYAIQRAIGRVMIKITYGERIWEEMGKDLTHWNLTAFALINKGFFTFWPVNIFHFLRFLPEWTPGVQFKALARESKEYVTKLRYEAYKRGLELYKSGDLGHCILNDILEEFGDDEAGDARDSTSMLYINAIDTTTSSVISCLHHLFLYPDVAQRMFEETQSVTHGQRMVKMTDRAHLPYCEAVLKEVIRRRPILPIGIPHVTTQDEILRGHLIPKGTIIHINYASILNDNRIWEQPELFKPERFLEPEAAQRPNPITIIFGYGMRTCPGMNLADRLVFHLMITINSLFKILPLEGKEIPDPTTIQYTDDAIQQPLGFECRFVPRDEKARHLLKTISLTE